MTLKRDQIIQGIQNRIITGDLPEGSRVLAQKIAKETSANPKTIGEALRLLLDQGLLKCQSGIGYSVAAGARERAEQARVDNICAAVPDLVAQAKIVGLEEINFVNLVKNAYRN